MIKIDFEFILSDIIYTNILQDKVSCDYK